MKSGAKGKGHDHYIRAAKQQVSQTRADAWKAALLRREKEREREGTSPPKKYSLPQDDKTTRNVLQAYSLYGYGPGDNVNKESKNGTVDTTLHRYQKRLDPGMPGGTVSAQLDRVRRKTP